MNLKNLVFFAFPAFFFSCSLEYYKSQNSEDSTPEFIFNSANFSRYENGKSKITLKAEKIEQYKSDSSTYAKNAEFNSYDDSGNLETEGSCGLLEAKTGEEKYKLFKNINLNMISEEMQVKAESLFFDKKSEQITSGSDSQVQILKNGMNVSGNGFSGSGVSKSFVFEYGVSGTIETNESENSNDDSGKIQKNDSQNLQIPQNEKKSEKS